MRSKAWSGGRYLPAPAWRGVVLAAAGLAAIVAGSAAQAAITGMVPVATGLSSPIFMTHAPGDKKRLFIVQRGGSIRILNLTTGNLEPTPFLTIPNVQTSGEGGLLGLAFHPDYATNGKFYVNVTLNSNGAVFQDAVSPFATRIQEYTRSTGNPNVADPTPKEVLSFLQPQSNHNGGWIGFSPKDGFLYIPTGDGGNANDLDPDGSDTDNDVGGHTATTGNAQDLTSNWLGKILRIDVDGDQFGDAARNYRIPNFQTDNSNPYAPKPDPNNVGQFIDDPGDDEIWASGVRNPFRNGFDRATGDLWLGDVGQGAREEIDFQPDGAGGRNYGWRIREGTLDNGAVPGANSASFILPTYEYPHSGASGGTVVTGGYRYRGPDPSLQGKYFFLDSNNSSVITDDKYWMFDPVNPSGTIANITSTLSPPAAGTFPVSFGEDAVGNLYIAYLVGGQVYRIATNQVTPGDFDSDAEVDADDLAIWTAGLGTAIGATNATGDADADGDVDGRDFLVWQRSSGYSSLNVGAGQVGVPEPAGAALAAVGVLALGWRRRWSAGWGALGCC